MRALVAAGVGAGLGAGFGVLATAGLLAGSLAGLLANEMPVSSVSFMVLGVGLAGSKSLGLGDVDAAGLEGTAGEPIPGVLVLGWVGVVGGAGVFLMGAAGPVEAALAGAFFLVEGSPESPDDSSMALIPSSRKEDRSSKSASDSDFFEDLGASGLESRGFLDDVMSHPFLAHSATTFDFVALS